MLVGALRKVGSDVVNRNPDRMIVARATSYMINALPARVQSGSQAGEIVWQSPRSELERVKAPVTARRMVGSA